MNIQDPSQNAQRYALFRQVHTAKTPQEIERAWQALENWQTHHPDDIVEGGFEMLALKGGEKYQTPYLKKEVLVS